MLCSIDKLKYAEKRYKTGNRYMGTYWKCNCGAEACKQELNAALKKAKKIGWDMMISLYYPAKQKLWPKPEPDLVKTKSVKPTLATFPPNWAAAKAVVPDEHWDNVKYYLELVVILWSVGSRALRPDFKEHDLLGHVLGGATLHMIGEHLAIIAECMFHYELNAYQSVYKALTISVDDNPQAGNLLPYKTLMNGRTTIQTMVEYAETIDQYSFTAPIELLIKAVRVL